MAHARWMMALLTVLLTAPAEVEAGFQVTTWVGTSDFTDTDRLIGDLFGTVTTEGTRGNGASYSATASVDARESASETSNVKLRTIATVHAPPAEFRFDRIQATADARWFDELSMTNPEILGNDGFSLSFLPTFEGSLSGTEARAVFSVGLVSDTSDFFRYTDYIIRGTSGQGTEGHYPLSVVYGYAYPTHLPILLSMRLSVSATAHPGDGMSQADYSNTASLGPILITDADGNYIPGSERLRIVGTSGITYAIQTPQVAAVPEPASWCLLMTGLLGFAGCLPRKIAKPSDE